VTYEGVAHMKSRIMQFNALTAIDKPSLCEESHIAQPLGARLSWNDRGLLPIDDADP